MIKKALLFEPAGYHHTLLPCYMKYLLDLGYDVDLLAHESFSLEDDFACLLDEFRPNVILFSDLNLSDVSEVIDFDAYDLIWVTTLNGFGKSAWKNPFDVLGSYPDPSDGLYGTIHAMDSVHSIGLDFGRFAQVFSLVDFGLAEPAIAPLSLSYYGEVPRYTADLNHRVNMLITGVSVSMPGVTRAMTERYDKELKVVAVGSTFNRDYWIHALIGQIAYFFTRRRGWKWYGAVPVLPMKLRRAVRTLDLRGYASSSELYAAVEQTDFLIANFEKDVLDKFSKRNISGQALFSLGFCKPLILPASVANFWGFDSSNSIVFEDGNFSDGMRRAMEISSEEYSELQQGLAIKAKVDYEASLDLLRNRIEESRRHRAND